MQFDVTSLGPAVGLLIVLGVTVGPWMFMVHAKLAVLSAKVSDLVDAMARLSRNEEERMPRCVTHAARLDAIEHRIAEIESAIKLRD